jgi:hypothetical protein
VFPLKLFSNPEREALKSNYETFDEQTVNEDVNIQVWKAGAEMYRKTPCRLLHPSGCYNPRLLNGDCE